MKQIPILYMEAHALQHFTTKTAYSINPTWILCERHFKTAIYKNYCSLLKSLVKVKMHCPASNYPISREFTLLKVQNSFSVKYL